MLANDSMSEVFGILRHPIRRKIVLLLADGPKKYSTIIKELNIYTGHLYYHLNAVKIMTEKQDGMYQLNEIGKKAVELLQSADKAEQPELEVKQQTWEY